MLNKETADKCTEVIVDGFIKPHLLWSSSTPEHLEMGGSCMFTNFWVGKPEEVKEAANKIALFYEQYLNENELAIPVSVGYWEVDGIGMITEMYTESELYEVRPDEIIEDYNLTQVLHCDNDNHPSLILENDVADLSISERISLAKLMHKDHMDWIDGEYREDILDDFSNDDFKLLMKSFAS
jgi:hypothetical protein